MAQSEKCRLRYRQSLPPLMAISLGRLVNIWSALNWNILFSPVFVLTNPMTSPVVCTLATELCERTGAEHTKVSLGALCLPLCHWYRCLACVSIRGSARLSPRRVSHSLIHDRQCVPLDCVRCVVLIDCGVIDAHKHLRVRDCQ